MAVHGAQTPPTVDRHPTQSVRHCPLGQHWLLCSRGTNESRVVPAQLGYSASSTVPPERGGYRT